MRQRARQTVDKCADYGRAKYKAKLCIVRQNYQGKIINQQFLSSTRYLAILAVHQRFFG